MAELKGISNTSLVTKNYEAFWFSSKVFYVRLYEDSYTQLEDITTLVNFQNEQNVGKTNFRVIHAEKYASISKEAREYLQKNAPNVKAEAYIIPSLSQKILFNLYVKFRKNRNPIKGFDQLEDALAWLNTFKLDD